MIHWAMQHLLPSVFDLAGQSVIDRKEGGEIALLSDVYIIDLASHSMPQKSSNNYPKLWQLCPTHRVADWSSC